MNNRKFGFGMMRLPLTNPDDAGSIDMELSKQMVDEFMKRGFTYFDTAWMYCGRKSESAVPELLIDRYPRESFTLTTKLPCYMLKTEEDRDIVFNEQLRKTQAGYFDYYLLHDVNAHNIKNFDRLDCWTWLREKKEQGIVKNIGFSYHDGPELLEKVLADHPEVDLVQLQINYLDWEDAVVQSRACYEVATKFGKPVIVMEPAKGGTLVANVPAEAKKMFEDYDPNMSVASWAIRFAASLDNVKLVLSGMSDMEQLLDNTGYMMDFKPLTEEELDMCKKAAKMINDAVAIPCTGCAYCIVDCPKNIPIPKYFSLYNAEQHETKRSWTAQDMYYSSLSKNFGKASDCIKCGKCENMCPQHLPIRKYLEKVAERLG